MKIYVIYEESSSGGEDLDPEAKWSDRADTIIDYKLIGSSLIKPDSWYFQEFELDCIEKPVDVFVVLVRYSDGDTFGQSFGNGHIDGVYLTKEEAQTAVKAIEEDELIKTDPYIPRSFRNGPYKHKPWKSYFANFESVQCYVMKLRETPINSKEPIRID